MVYIKIIMVLGLEDSLLKIFSQYPKTNVTINNTYKNN